MNAFENWLCTNYETEYDIAAELYAQIIVNHNPQIKIILEATGDKSYTRETFYKAAKLLKQKFDKEITKEQTEM